MNSAEAAEEGPNEPDTEPFFKTGGLGVSACACGWSVWVCGWSVCSLFCPAEPKE